MHEFGRKRQFLLLAILGVGYFVIGYGSAALDPLIPHEMRFMWRLASWVACAVAFTAHIRYEHKHSSSPPATAFHAAIAVAIGGFLIAAAAAIHAAAASSHAPFQRHLLALVLWPLVTAIPAFVVALAAASATTLFSRKRLPD